MKLVSAENQQKRHPLYVADGTITTGGTAQLVLARSQARSHIIVQNLSTGPLYMETGSARATCSLTSGTVTGTSITNAGFNFTKPPVIEFLGGGYAGNTTYLGLGQPNGASPDSSYGTTGRPAKAHAVLSGGALNSIVIDDPGVGYATAPFVFIYNSDLDPNGCALPSATSGILLQAGAAPLIYNGTACFTDSIALFGATTGQAFMLRWMD